MPIDALTALYRFGLGARPGDARRAAHDPKGYLIEQIEERDRLAPLAKLTPANEGHRLRFDFRARGGKSAQERERLKVAFARAYQGDPILYVRHLVLAEAGFAERLALFWANHLHVPNYMKGLQPLRGSYENDVIRAHALGRFDDMLEASSGHPAMLVYLDQVRSVGPNSPVGKRRGLGLNENYARELLELHAMGVGRYDQNDVTKLAALLTGWVVRSPIRWPEEAGRATFVTARHEPGPHEVLGTTYDGSPRTLRSRLVADLAAHPATARFVARKFARAFVPEPSDALNAYLERVFRDTRGDLRELARALVLHDDAWEGSSDGKAGFASPFLYTIATARALGTLKPRLLRNASARMGERIWGKPAPDGWPPSGPHWFGGQALEARLALARELAAMVDPDRAPTNLAKSLMGERLSAATRRMLEGAATPQQAYALLAMAPETMLR